MSYRNNSFNNKKENTMSEEKFNQIIDAILDGKYSWACVLILETAGYNPLHYIPYRTYNRLIKINCTSNQLNTQSQTKSKQNSSPKKGQEYPSSSKIQDLDHVKTNYNQKIQGGIASINFLNFRIYI